MQDNDPKLKLYVVCDDVECDLMPLHEMFPGNSTFDKGQKKVTRKDVERCDFRSLLYYYPELLGEYTKKKLITWREWSETQNVPRECYILRSWKKIPQVYGMCAGSYPSARQLLDKKWVHEKFFDIPPTEENPRGGTLKKEYTKIPIPKNDKSQAARDTRRAAAETPAKKKSTKSVPSSTHVNQHTNVPVDTNIINNNDDETDTEEGVFPELLPEKIMFENKDLFEREDGSKFVVEIRGKFSPKGIYFNARDVGEFFEIKRVEQTLSTNSYTEGEHYKRYKCKGLTKKEELYLSYIGLIQIIFSSRSKIAKDFQWWIIDILYAYQYGDRKETIQLAAKTMGVPYIDMKDMYSQFSGRLVGIYLFLVGKVRDHREYINNNEKLDDDEDIYKFGLTKDYVTRLKTHQSPSHFGKGIIPIAFAYVHVGMLGSEEKSIKTLTHKLGKEVSYQNKNSGEQKEVFCMSSENIDKVIKAYKNIHEIYIGSEEEKLTHARNEIKQMVSSNEAELAKQSLKDILAVQSLKDLQVSSEQSLKDLQVSCDKKEAELVIKNLKIEHEKELLVRELASQKEKYELMLENERLKVEVFKMKAEK